MCALRSARFAGGVIWGAVLVLCCATVPFEQTRTAADNRAMASHGCDADDAVSEAEGLIKTFSRHPAAG